MKAADMRIKMVEEQEAHERELDKQIKQRKIELDKERRRELAEQRLLERNANKSELHK